ncbi:MAG: biotin transporter BioY [Pseudomonadota bacterium]
MKPASLTYPTLTDALWSSDRALVRNTLLVVAGSLALWASAKLSIPFWPVPMTMQTFMVLVIGMTFGWKLGGLTVALYLFQGAIGMPVFSGSPERGIGLAYLFGPTGGYLMGFFAAAVITGWLAERGWDRRVLTAFAAIAIGIIVIYASGLAWLSAWTGWGQPLLAAGLFPFVLAELVKMALAAAVLPLGWKLLDRRS